MLRFLPLIFLLSGTAAFGQTMKYSADLRDCVKDQVKVSLSCAYKGKDTAYFNFPMTIPGTYAVLDYGRYISQFKAYDSNGKALKINKKGNNTFIITPGKDVATITYTCDDSWEEKNKKTKIFEPAGTGFEAGAFFYVNAGGLFGFFNEEYDVPFNVKFKKPDNLTGYTTLHQVSLVNNEQEFSAKSYHELIDNPILFTGEKEQSLKIADTKVSVASYYNASDSSGYYVKVKIDSAMQAIDKFTGGNLPVNHYAFLNFVKDYRDIGEMLMSGKLGPLDYVKIIRKLGGQGFGALEHGHSSSYFMPDFGKNSYAAMIEETAIHEFMHIYTPLSLHSQHIGGFNYVHPVMSKHLWLYEGCTEYFAVQIAMQGGLNTVEETLYQGLSGKIATSYSYPDSIPFTVMSANVFDKPYADLYGQVYERGAVMAFLLDVEIMRLTDGKKTLKTVIFELSKKYGADKSFNEATFIDEFVATVHPDLKQYFDKYVTGKNPLPIAEQFKLIGVDYTKEKKAIVPVNILGKENGVKANTGIQVNGRVTVSKADKGNFAGLKKGDKVDLIELKSVYTKDGVQVAEGTMVTIHVERKGQLIPLTYAAKFKEGTIKNSMEIMKEMTPEQARFFKIWTEGI